MMKRSYNSVGAGDKPRLGKCSSVEVESRPGGAQSLDKVTISTDIPKTGRPGGAERDIAASGEPPKAARAGGAQGI